MDEEIFNLETAEFPHSIDLEALQRETGLSLQAGASTKTLFGVAQSNAIIPHKVNGSNISLSDLANFFRGSRPKISRKEWVKKKVGFFLKR